MRFVILEHRIANSTHWDLMLAGPHGGLRTWALDRLPPGRGWRAARPLPEHRELYLRYQGPIAGMRGFVRRWDTGTYRILLDLPAEVRMILHGARLRGVLEIRAGSPDSACYYRFRPTSA